MKKNKFLLLATSLITLVPMFYGLAVWDQLPQVLPTHWGIDGTVDGWSEKSFCVFTMPLCLLGVHLVCAWITGLDAINQTGNGFIQRTILCIIPAISLFAGFSSFGILTDPAGDTGVLFGPMVGLMFLILGNSLPKCRQNAFIGIRLPWTYSSEENWNRTHRLAGRVWVVCGGLMVLSGLLDSIPVLILLILAAVTIPTVYSWWFYRQQKREGVL